MNEKHQSDSTTQKNIEKTIIDKLVDFHGCELLNKIEGYSFEPDFFNKERRIVGEIYCGIEKLKSAQKHKIMADCFKLVAIEKVLGGKWEKYIIVVDEKIKKSLEGPKTWSKLAMDELGITLKLLLPNDKELIDLQKAKEKQQKGMTTTSSKI